MISVISLQCNSVVINSVSSLNLHRTAVFISTSAEACRRFEGRSACPYAHWRPLSALCAKARLCTHMGVPSIAQVFAKGHASLCGQQACLEKCHSAGKGKRYVCTCTERERNIVSACLKANSYCCNKEHILVYTNAIGTRRRRLVQE